MLLFLGSHSIFSNLYPCKFQIDNICYNSVEQYLQCQKAATFDDNLSQTRIMRETNMYKIKKFGSKIKCFNHEHWKRVKHQATYRAVCAKFSQNLTLKSVLLDTGTKLVAESSANLFWGTGLHLRDRNALDQQHWKSSNGGAMCEILKKSAR